ncbi:hypothetical protein ABEB36_011141 [Hypothenemus hampei]
MAIKLFLVLVSVILHLSNGQTGNIIRDELVTCFNNSALPGITTADRRPPSDLNLLVEFIRKIEDANPTMTQRELSLLILQEIRQDGIQRTERTLDERFGVPYSSSRVERLKFNSLLRQFLPNGERKLDFGDLSDYERCSLHYMISNTIDDIRRDNEATDCSRSARYTARIFNRWRRDDTEEQNVQEDLEETESLGLGVSVRSTQNVSSCPIELGVVYSPSGTFKVGNFLSGITAGLNQQNVENVDNRYAATITGELCEALLYQAASAVSLGAAGGWNSTLNPKYFFLQSNVLLQSTDAELRGALDGLYIALQLDTLLSRNSDFRISQLIDMYYSPYEKGVLDSSFKACNRYSLYSNMTNTETMTTQLFNYMPVLNRHAISGSSLTSGVFQELTNVGIQAFNTYLPHMASSDLACLGESTIERVATDFLIYFDSGWNYNTVQLVLSYILDNIDVNKFQSRYTVYGGSSLNNITSQGTRYLADFYIQFNQTTYNNETAGFNYVGIFEAVENYGRNKLNNNSYAGGESTIVLLVTRTSLTDDQRTFLTQRREIFNNQLPDIEFLVLGVGSESDYSAIVTNTNRVAILQDTTSEDTLRSIGQQVVNNIKQIPRAIINPGCTSQYTGSSSTFFVTDYVEPLGVNYYRISPNYFATGGENRNLRIREKGYGTINVCLSRDTSRPDNSSGSDCSSLQNSEKVVDITNYCSDSVNSCQPIYISVIGGNSSVQCKSTLCRFPDDIQYQITLENAGCATGSSVMVTVSTITVFIMFLQIALFVLL